MKTKENMIRKILLILFSLILFTACSGKKKKQPVQSVNHELVIETEQLTDEEKELRMIQGVIRDYNEDKISDRQEYFQILIPQLPIGITELPEVNSLKDLDSVEIDQNVTNAVFAGQYKISDEYSMFFRIYHPTTDMFWTNGDVSFRVDPASVELDNPTFSEYKNVVDNLFSKENDILNWLYGINVDLGNEIESGYYEVKGMGDYHPESIEEIRQMAEEVFTYDFLNEYYYPTAFNSSVPVYKMIGNKLCCVVTDLIIPPFTGFSSSHILAAENTDDGVRINLLSTKDGVVQPEIYEIRFVSTPQGYRLPSAY